MKTKSVRRRVALAFMAVAILSISGRAAAYETYFPPYDYHLAGGVNGNHYYFSANVTATLQGHVQSAKYNWGIALPGQVAWAETSNAANAEIRFTQASVDSGSTCARTTDYSINDVSLNNGAGNPTSSWAYSKITIYPAYFTAGNGNSGGGCGNDVGVIAHEMGHAMGLAHEDNTNYAAIMRSYIALMNVCCGGQTWAAPKVDDKCGIQWLFYTQVCDRDR